MSDDADRSSADSNNSTSSHIPIDNAESSSNSTDSNTSSEDEGSITLKVGTLRTRTSMMLEIYLDLQALAAKANHLAL